MQKIIAAALALCACAAVLSVLYNLPVSAIDNEQTKALMEEYNAGKYEAAFTRCTGILLADQKNITAHYYMGNLYLRYNKLDQAAAEYKYCMEKGTDALEVAAAKQGLEAIEDRRSGRAPVAPMAHVSAPDSPELKAKIDRLRAELAEQLDARKKKYDADMAKQKDEMNAQMMRDVNLTNGNRSDLTRVRESQSKERSDKADLLKATYMHDYSDLTNAFSQRVRVLREGAKSNQSSGPGGH
jgi:hypothetical protein